MPELSRALTPSRLGDPQGLISILTVERTAGHIKYRRFAVVTGAPSGLGVTAARPLAGAGGWVREPGQGPDTCRKQAEGH